jgi:hypothetical protein
MATIKKAQNGFKSAIVEQTKRVNRRKNNLTTGDLHTDPNVSPAKQFGSKISRSAEKILNPKGFEKEGKPNKVLSALSKKKNGGSLSAIKKTSSKRAGSVDPKGAFTTVQKRTLAGAKGKASLTKDKQLGATKMAKCGTSISKKK